jgi:hypothetical protein
VDQYNLDDNRMPIGLRVALFKFHVCNVFFTWYFNRSSTDCGPGSKCVKSGGSIYGACFRQGNAAGRLAIACRIYRGAQGRPKVKRLVLALLATTLSLSVSAASINLNSSRSNAAEERGKPTKEQMAQCNAKQSPSEKRACQQQFGIAVSDPGAPSPQPVGGCTPWHPPCTKPN